MTMSTLPGFDSARRISFCCLAVRKRLSISIVTGKAAKRRLKVSKCWKASTVVGASTATCLPSLHGLEGGAHGDFGLAVAHVAAQQAVHGLRRFHVALDVGDGRELVVGLVEFEGVFEFASAIRVSAGKAWPCAALRCA